MDCRLNKTNAKIFSKAVESLGKFGADLFLEADENGLLLRAINSTRSAVGSFKFKRLFFDSFNIAAGGEQYCKITMKACRNVFRHMKQVESCELRICPEISKFLVNVKCRYDQMKKVTISIMDEENITADVSSDHMQNSISGSHKIFSEISSNFSSAEEEITFETIGDTLTAKNYIEQSRVNDRFMRSRLKLDSTEFLTYKIDAPSTITFCLKEFRAFLLFAEATNETVVLKFQEAGSPVFFNIKNGEQIEGVLIMSTLCPEDISFHEELRESELVLEKTSISDAQKRKTKDDAHSTATTKTKKNDTHFQKPKERAPKRSEVEKHKLIAEKRRKFISEATTISNLDDDDELLFQFNSDVNFGNKKNSNNNNNNNNNNSIRNRSSIRDSLPSIEIPRTVVNSNLDSLTNDNRRSLRKSNDDVRNSPPKSTESVEVTFYDTEDQTNTENVNDEVNLDEHIPQSPQRQSTRFIFARCFQKTYVPQQPSPNSQAFVPDSDSED